jgi:hypothetical protein
MAGTNFSKVWASMLAGVLAAGLLAAMLFAPGAVDPGHGGNDTGAVNKSYNLSTH